MNPTKDPSILIVFDKKAKTCSRSADELAHPGPRGPHMPENIYV